MQRGKNQTVVDLSTSKNIKLLVFGCLGAAMGYWMFQMPDADIAQQRIFESPHLVHGLGLFLIVTCVLSAIGLVVKMSSDEPGVVLDDQGLTDNASFLSAGFIAWKDITGTEVREIGKGQATLYVLLKDSEKYIAACGPLKRLILKACKVLGPSPVSIPVVALEIDVNQLATLVDSYLTKYRESATLMPSRL